MIKGSFEKVENQGMNQVSSSAFHLIQLEIYFCNSALHV